MRCLSTRALVFSVVCLAAAALVPVRGQQPGGQKPVQPTFRVEVEYVEVDAMAHDKSGRFIADLKKDDFEVYEDGKPQKVENLELVNVPVETESPLPVLAGRQFVPDVVSNTAAPGRIYLIVLDDLHISPARSVPAQKLAKQFIETNVAPTDLVAVVTTSGNRRAAQEFTADRGRLFDAVGKCIGKKPMAPAMADMMAPGTADMSSNAYTGGGSKVDESQRVLNARTSLAVLEAVANLAGTIRHRRKAIVLVGEGIEYDLGKQEMMPTTASADDQPGTDPRRNDGIPRRELRDRMRDFISVANRRDVTLYALDPTVYTQQGDDLIDLASAPPNDYDKLGRELVRGSAVQDDLVAAQDNLRTIATETGGFAVTGSLKAAENAFARIRDENSHYYVLGYYPTNDKRDGKYRRIEVRVKRPGVQVQARRGYTAAKAGQAAAAPAVQTKEGTSPELREALMSAIPSPGLPISVVATPFRGANGNGSVLVMLQTPPAAVKFAESNGKVEGNLELSFVAIDDQGKTRGGEHLELAMPLKKETQAVVDRVGLLVQSRVALPPGRYVLRVGARDVVADRVGSVHCDVEVPEYAKAPLSMSGLVVSSAETAVANPRPDKELTSLLPGSPAVIREFRQTDSVGVLAEIYDTKLATPHDIDIVTTVLSEDGKEAYRHEDKHSSAELQGMQGGFGYLLKIPLANVAPGACILRVEARSQLDTDHPVVRETAFRVIRK